MYRILLLFVLVSLCNRLMAVAQTPSTPPLEIENFSCNDVASDGANSRFQGPLPRMRSDGLTSRYLNCITYYTNCILHSWYLSPQQLACIKRLCRQHRDEKYPPRTENDAVRMKMRTSEIRMKQKKLSRRILRLLKRSSGATLQYVLSQLKLHLQNFVPVDPNRPRCVPENTQLNFSRGKSALVSDDEELALTVKCALERRLKPGKKAKVDFKSASKILKLLRQTNAEMRIEICSSLHQNAELP